jgi:TolB-like protein/tetratricopeptide (TPR) repeat protein
MSFFTELKRRNVFRVALLYLVASWLIIQVADTGVSLLGLPEWTGRLVFLLLLIGLPLVVLFSWAYEITPEGLKREKEVERNESITHETARKLNMAVIVLLLLAVGGMIADRLIPEQLQDTQAAADAGETNDPTGQSIAVLPFVNMSADPENEYFSDGLSEELLNLLAKIPELKVAARTSAFSFKNSDAGIAEIADTLNVAHVLEGSVRKSGDQIRITAQLIKGSDGYHLWSRTWDRTLIDVFAIQDEIAAAVVDALKVTLLGELPHASVTDTRAYELYLQAKVFADMRTKESLERAARLLTEALVVDPDYAEAWVELSVVRTNQVGASYLAAEEGYASARAASERALELDPDNPRALSNLGWLAMYWDWDFETAVRLISRAKQLAPGNASVLNAYAVLVGAFGRLDSMIANYEEALQRDPVSMSVLANLAGASLAKDPLGRSLELVGQMRRAVPGSITADVFEGWAYQFGGEPQLALDAFERVDDIGAVWGRTLSLYDLGRDDESDAAIEELEKLGGTPAMISAAYAHRDDHDRAFESLARGLEEKSESMVEIRMYDPFRKIHDDPRWHDLLEKVGISDADAERLGL